MSQDTYLINQAQLQTHVGELKRHHTSLVAVMDAVKAADRALISKGKEGWESHTQREFVVVQKKWENAYRDFNAAFAKLAVTTTENGDKAVNTDKKLAAGLGGR